MRPRHRTQGGADTGECLSPAGEGIMLHPTRHRRLALVGLGSVVMLTVTGLSPVLGSESSVRSPSSYRQINTMAPAKGLEDPIPAPIRHGRISVGLRTIATGLVSPVA